MALQHAVIRLRKLLVQNEFHDRLIRGYPTAPLFYLPAPNNVSNIFWSDDLAPAVSMEYLVVR
jgi:hypothetical protein